ncbi:hypothetical protein B0H21DRAFT_708198 [Amylocystis lapponica]|nr:hypothetical protein B0H21DRAFT_708198 [Amylocystis lapponica]
MNTTPAPSVHRIASIDPPGMKRDKLPSVMKRPAFRYEDVPALMKAPIYDTLPRSLMPSTQPKYKPPVMRYGWPADFERLMKRAKELDVLVEVDIDDLVGDLDGPIEDLQTVTTTTVDEIYSVNKLLSVACAKLPPNKRERIRLEMTLNARIGVIISIYTNYNLDTPVPDSVMKEFHSLFMVRS